MMKNWKIFAVKISSFFPKRLKKPFYTIKVLFLLPFDSWWVCSHKSL